ncbi:MAG: xanthine dehydrogenase molybdopterin binding subunit [Burkholderiaceae bacterium]
MNDHGGLPTPGAPLASGGQVRPDTDRSPAHESALAHVTGSARFIDDLPEAFGTLHCAPVLSPLAHARLRGLAPEAVAQALADPAVHAIVRAADIPGEAAFHTPAADEPVLATDSVHYQGQVVALVVADSHRQARVTAARLQQALQLEPLPAVLSIDEALRQQAWVLPPVCVIRGEPEQALARATHTLGQTFEIGGQEHFYLESQIAYALPQEQDGWLIHSSTQHPGEVQHWVASALGIAANRIDVVCRRMGGGFGGKETQAGHVAVWAALAARAVGRPVKMRLDRDDDILITGKRHPMRASYTVGYNDAGAIQALSVSIAANCGSSADLSGPVTDRTVFHVDNAYFLPNVRIELLRCRLNTQSHTAFRGFGGPQGMVVIETIIEQIAHRLGLDPLDVRRINLYGAAPRNTTHYGMTVGDNVLPELLGQLEAWSDYRARRAAIAAFNRSNSTLKKGIALTPVKFGISFTATQFNQAGALVNLYTDGTVQVNHGGTEMGQGLHTKVCQIVAAELGVPLEAVRISATDTARVPNASATAASSGTDLNGRAAEFAARRIRERLSAFIAGRAGVAPDAVRIADGVVSLPDDSKPLTDWIKAAYEARIQLFSDGFYATPDIHYDRSTLTGQPFYYFAYGAAVSEVAIDTLTGESRVLAVDILHDTGRPINRAIDLGQIEGGFIQGMGWLTTEELVWDEQGRLRTHAPSTYKIPTAYDLPPRWRIALWNRPNPKPNVHGSKAVGEPPLMLAISVLQAIRHAVQAATGEATPVVLHAPASAESVQRALGGPSAS